MKEKILIFIYAKKEEKFLLLPDCFTITKDIKGIKDTKKIIKKEIKNKIGPIVKDIFSLNWGSTYKLKNEEIKEMNFIVFVDSNKAILNKRYSKYKWSNINEYLKKIKWNDNKILLKKVLEKGINKELYFDKKERGQ